MFIIGKEDLLRKRFAPGSRGADGRAPSVPVAAVASTATITTIPGASHVDPEFLVLDDGVNPTKTFEFDEDGSVTPGNILVDTTNAFDPQPTADEMRDRLIIAINGETGPAFALAASDGGAGTVLITHQTPGISGDLAGGSEDVADAGFVLSVFAGGADSEAARPFRGSIQPAPGEILETLSEGERSRGVRLLFTRTDLRTVDQRAKTAADTVTRVVDGTEWEVRTAGPWPKLLKHGQVVLVRLQEVAP